MISKTNSLFKGGQESPSIPSDSQQPPESYIPPPIPISPSSVQPEAEDSSKLLWILSGGNTNAFVNYLRTFPDPALEKISKDPRKINQLVQEFKSQNLISPPGESDGIPNTEIRSSNVVGMRYDPKTQQMLVKFWGGGGGKKDPIYSYDDVPPVISSILEHGNAFAQTTGKNARGQWWKMKNPSIGAAVNQYLKGGGYAYKKIS